MKNFLIALAFIATPFLALGGDTAPAAPAAGGGEALYAKYKCSICHMINGKGGKMCPDLSKVGAKLDKAKIAVFIQNPKKVNPKSKMPAGKMTPAEADQIGEYLAGLK